jgi:hypothetical protein
VNTVLKILRQQFSAMLSTVLKVTVKYGYSKDDAFTEGCQNNLLPLAEEFGIMQLWLIIIHGNCTSKCVIQ